jgi:hypothetical protein
LCLSSASDFESERIGGAQAGRDPGSGRLGYSRLMAVDEQGTHASALGEVS